MKQRRVECLVRDLEVGHVLVGQPGMLINQCPIVDINDGYRQGFRELRLYNGQSIVKGKGSLVWVREYRWDVAKNEQAGDGELLP